MKLTSRQQQLLRRTFIDYNPTAEFLENPLVMERAEGLYCWDYEGKRYFDAIRREFSSPSWVIAIPASWKRYAGRWSAPPSRLLCTRLPT